MIPATRAHRRAEPIPSIPTSYNGRIFRSRFEADTARKLDRAGFAWDYEPQSFLLDGGIHYWPDFLITAQPDGTPCRIWMECRGYVTDKGEAQIAAFARQLKTGESYVVLRTPSTLRSTEWFEPPIDGHANGDGNRGGTFLTRIAAYECGRGEEFDRLCAELRGCRDRLASAPSEAAKDDLLMRMHALAKMRRECTVATGTSSA